MFNNYLLIQTTDRNGTTAKEFLEYVTCSAIWGLLGKDDDLRASHELLNTERIL